ncbi:MAG: NAD-glutamate dehydrogenase [Rhizobiaceae bacterium]
MVTQFGRDNKSLIAAALKHLPKTKQLALKSFASSFLERAPDDDLKAISPKILAELIASAEKASRKHGLVVEALTDGKKDHQHTLIILSMKNRPFIMDSLLASLSSEPLEVQLVVHPIIDGTSIVLVVLDQSTSAQRLSIRKNLETVIEQIRRVTNDWKPMVKRVEEAISAFRYAPPPLPAQKIAEGVQFLEWLIDNNFTIQGLREYTYSGTKNSGQLKPIKSSSLGILRDEKFHLMTRGGKPVVITPEIRDFLFSDDPIFITKANHRSLVHRRTHLDYIGIKRYDENGKLAGELRVVGLFTSTAYTKSVLTIPVLRHKAHAVLEVFKSDPDSHTGKALINILETWPRDEMFQLDIKTLAKFAQIAAQLEERPRVRVLPRADKFDRFVSIITYVPRERYDTQTRIKMGEYLAKAYDGYLSAFYPNFMENGLTRVHFIIGRSNGKTPFVSRAKLEAAITQISLTWEDNLTSVSARPIAHKFPLSYQEHVCPQEAVKDSELLESLSNDSQIAVDFHDTDARTKSDHRVSLKMFHLNSALPLSIRVPMLENMGFRVIEESTFDIIRNDGSKVFLHDMILENANGAPIDRQQTDILLKEALLALWGNETDSDNFNALILRVGLNWKQAALFRAYAGYLRQIRSRFTITSMAETLINHEKITAQLFDLFTIRFNPSTTNRTAKEQAKIKKITSLLEAVQSSDDDRILRNMLNMIIATLRTNFYSPVLNTKGSDAAPTPVLAFKVDPAAINIMPKPVPYREIFVSSPRVEGLHLRFGPVARGGLRWSDRSQDYRTEVLGLVKAQQVKNAVIVPVGSKGGFIPKHLPTGGDRNAWFEEGKFAYKVFISSLLSLTDNLINGKVVPPKMIVRHDGDDPYFVVAADKGTSTFSDTANAISQANDFWLDDAFASGGSAGYDHKKMGITARGAWEAVKRHFREIDRDIQSEPFTAAGVGDMSGDVFGNGMLLSKQTQLIAAFDHRDIFIDPNPDCASSFKERARIFKLNRSSWQDYNKKLISKGGGIFPRSAKTITLSKQAAAAIGFNAGNHTPQAIMNAILKAPVDLMWFGGIGTYIRASHESDVDAGDRGNDAIRVTARELRCKAIGEGANLGVTHPARIEFNMLGGRCNSDAIDNSAGVNSSDVEVNIKIALAAAMKSKKLSRAKRNTLLVSMTKTVAELVLRNNYLQTLSISLSQKRGMEDFSHHQRLMQSLEARNLLDRVVEDLPDEAMLAERQKTATPLTRAEIGVLLAYAKIVALDDLVASKVPDDPYLKNLLVDYFPPKMQKTYAKEITNHRLHREIIGTVLANSMINRGGPTFLSRVADRTGAKLETIAQAYVAVRDAFQLPAINNAIDALDTKISGDTQLQLYTIVQDRVIEQTVWFVRYGDFSKGIASTTKAYASAVETLMPKLEKIVPPFLATRINHETAEFISAGVPKELARTLARLPIAGLIPDINFAAHQTNKSLTQAATTFFSITEAFQIGKMAEAVDTIETNDYYDGLALDRALQNLNQARRDIVIDALSSNGNAKGWLEANDAIAERTKIQISAIVDNDQATVSKLTVAANILADLARK